MAYTRDEKDSWRNERPSLRREKNNGEKKDYRSTWAKARDEQKERDRQEWEEIHQDEDDDNEYEDDEFYVFVEEDE